MSFDKVIVELKDAINFLKKNKRETEKYLSEAGLQDDVGMAMCIMDKCCERLEEQRAANLSFAQTKQLLGDNLRMLQHYSDMTEQISKIAEEHMDMIKHNARMIGETATRMSTELNNMRNFRPKSDLGKKLHNITINRDEVPF